MSILFAIVTIVFITAMSALAGRAHGSGWSSIGRVLAKVWLGGLMGYGNYLLWGLWPLALVGVAVTVWAFSTGHGRVYQMKGADQNQTAEQLEKLFGWLWQGSINKPSYSWFIMGLKGLFIGLPIAPVGLLLYILWPAAYSWSFKSYNSNEPAEWVSCGFAGFLAGVVIALKLLGV